MKNSASPSNNDKSPFFTWNGRFGRFIEGWNKFQWWWWVGIISLMMAWFSYDVGQLVARADILSGSQNVKGSITISQAIEKSAQSPGGRLVIASSTDARFIDSNGVSWNIPNFSKTTTQGEMDSFFKNGVTVDGKFSIDVRPVKTKPSDLLVTTVTDLLLKIIFIAFYATIFYFIMKHFRGQKGRFKKIQSGSSPVKIKDVAGYDGVKNELLEVVDYLRNPKRFTLVGAHPPRGVLLYGPPGTGKTLMAKAVAGEAAATFFEQSASSFVEIYAGEGAKAVRKLFDEARKSAPSVIFIDEIDAAGGARSSSSHNEQVQTLNAILTEMDGFGDNQGLVVVAATNRLEVLDEALVRPGRFDRKVWIGMPTVSDRESILRTHAKNIQCDQDVDWRMWSLQTKGFSGADLAALVNESAIEAARNNANQVNNDHVSKARDRVWIGAKNHGQILSDTERNIVAIHELGHAWMRLYTKGHIEKVSISPRGQSLGVTVSVADDEKFLHTKLDIQKELMVLMGGRAAEEIIFNDVTGGAMDDMHRASILARDAVLRLGSVKWGAYIPNEDNKKYIDDEATTMVNSALEKSVSVLSPQRELILKASDILQQNEELSEMDLLKIWGPAIELSSNNF